MRFPRLTLATVLALLSVWMAVPAATALAQQGTPEVFWLPLAQAYNPSSTSYIYCSASPADSPWHKVQVKITSTTTTISAVTAGQAPFFTMNSIGGTNFVVKYNVSGITKYGKITAIASADSATVNVAPGLPAGGASFEWAQVNVCGTTSADGWISTSGYAQVNFTYQLDTLGSTSIDMKVECKDEGPLANPIAVYPAVNYTATGAIRIVINEPYAYCRLGQKVNTDGADSVTVGVYLKTH